MKLFDTRVCRYPSCARAFTLVELLVAIGIIAVLNAILLPATWNPYQWAIWQKLDSPCASRSNWAFVGADLCVRPCSSDK